MKDSRIDGRLDRLFAETGGRTAPEPLVSAISERLRTGLERSAASPSAAGLALRLFLSMVLVALALASLIGMAGLAQMSVVQRLLVSLALASGAALLGISLAWQTLPGSLHRVSPWMALALSMAAFLGAVALLFPLEEGGISPSGFQCTRGGVAMAIPAALLLWMLVRRGAPQAYTLLGTTIGATAGLVAVAVLQFHCPQQDVIHLGLWHGSVALLCGVAGFGAGLALRERQRNYPET